MLSYLSRAEAKVGEEVIKDLRGGHPGRGELVQLGGVGCGGAVRPPGVEGEGCGVEDGLPTVRDPVLGTDLAWMKVSCVACFRQLRSQP